MSYPQDVANAVQAHRAIAANITASLSIPTSPAVVTYTNAYAADSQFNISTGVMYFAKNTEFTSVYNATLDSTSGTSVYYVDAEVSTDGTNWTRGTYSLRIQTVRSSDSDVTCSFPFSGYFAAGTYLRFVHWASTTNIAAVTRAVSGSNAPAIRLTYSRIPAVLLP